MGRRAAHESAVAILAAFLEKRRWRQGDLAERVGVEPRALRKCLETMVRAGVPLAHEPAPPYVRWVMSESWLPEAVALSKRDAKAAGQLIGRLKPSSERDELLSKLLGPSALLLARADRPDLAPSVLRRLEDARRERVVARLAYRSLTRGSDASTTRLVSIHHIAYGEHDRFFGLERGANQLKTYRVDRVAHVELDPSGIFRDVAREDLDAFVRASIHGFHGGGDVETHVFVVREPEAAWVRTNLPVDDANVTDEPEGIRVEIATAAPGVLARYVVGLGGAARVESEGLRERVRAIATSALTASFAVPDGGGAMPRAKAIGPAARAKLTRRVV